MGTIVPPASGLIKRKAMRRLKAYRCAQFTIVFASLALISLLGSAGSSAGLSNWVWALGVASCGAALLTAIGAVVFRIVETPREVSIHDYWKWSRKGPPVIYLGRKD